MTSVTERQGDVFRIDMLWTDARYRSSFIQLIAFLLLMMAIFWLANNMLGNLAAAGKDLSFNYLFQSAGYDINQMLIDYTNQSPHWRAALVGALNTLLVAFLGCITCTVIGVIAGVLRLSKNWVVSRLMLVYIEAVRNVPLLLQILLWYAIFIEALPAPNQFRGDDPAASMWFDAVAATNRGFFVPRPIFEDGSTFLVVAFLLSVVGLFVWNRWRKAYQERTGLEMPEPIAKGAVGFAGVFALAMLALVFPTDLGSGFVLYALKLILGVGFAAGLGWLLWKFPVLSIQVAILTVPVVLAFFVSGQPISLAYPVLKGFNFTAGEGEAIHLRNSLMALWLALSIYTGAFVAEIVRGGIVAVSKGQTEAAAALGLRPNRIMSLVILPQALRIIIPPQISQYLNLTKNSSLAIAVGYMDITGTLGGITMNQTGREMESMLLLMAFYLTISLTISAVINAFNERIKLRER
jgi:general L-amino acid transport system permease protein